MLNLSQCVGCVDDKELKDQCLSCAKEEFTNYLKKVAVPCKECGEDATLKLRIRTQLSSPWFSYDELTKQHFYCSECVRELRDLGATL
jgi:hypothetical protein